MARRRYSKRPIYNLSARVVGYECPGKGISTTECEKREADRIIVPHHYSRKVTKNSCLSMLVTYHGKVHGALQMGYGIRPKIKGEYDKAQTYYHPFYDEGYKYNSSIVDLSVRYEYNFWPYGTGKEYRGAVRWAPFVALGIGLTGVKCQERTVDYATSERMTSSESLVTANIPLGIGVNYRYGDRMNFALQWMMHFSLSDQLDGVKDPSYVKSNGLFKNTDCYSVLMFTLTYSFSAKCPTCMKDR